jgi:hypothetical protein
MGRRTLMVLLLFIFGNVYGQTKIHDADKKVKAMIEFLIDNYGDVEAINLEELRLEEYWLEMIINPLNINQINEYELSKKLPLNPLQIQALMEYKRKAGPLIDLHELQAIPGWSISFIKLLKPFIKTENLKGVEDYIGDILKEGRHQLEIRGNYLMQKSAGYLESIDKEKQFLGGRTLRQIKYGYANGKQLRFGLVGELDAGEQFRLDKKTKGLDYLGYYFSVQINRKYLTKLVLGDYTVCIGQGLMLWQGFGANKGSDVMNIKNQNRGIEPYRSFSENWAMRGIGLEGKIGKKEWMLFFSKRGVDVKTYEKDSVSTIEGYREITTGLHRTQEEITTKHNMKKYIYGYSMQHVGQRMKWGIHQVFSSTSTNPAKGFAWYQKFDLNNNNHSNIGLDFSCYLGGTHVFGEMAIDQNRASALYMGTLSALSNTLSFSTFYRKLQPGFHSIMGSIPNEFGQIRNEHGMYVGLQLRPRDKISINFYIDFFKSPWLRYQLSAPTFGKEIMMHVQYSPTKKSEFMVRFKEEQKPRSIAFENEPLAEAWAFVIKRNFRIQYRVEVSENSTLTFRVESQKIREKVNRGESKQGSLVYFDLKKRIIKKKITVNFWTGYAAIEDAEAVIYYFEPDPVVGTVKMVSAYKNELNWGISGTCTFYKRLKISVKLAENRYSKLQVFGSGSDQWVGKKKTEMSLKLVYAWL